MKTLKITTIVILVLLIIPLACYGLWLLKKGKPLEVVVVNKSMTNFRKSENKAFNYLLNREKVYTSGNRIYDLKVDHLGLHWDRGEYRINYPRLKEVERTAEKADIVYYANVSGIMTSQLKSYIAGDENQLEYGGMNNTDYTLIRELIRRETPLILEYSYFGPSTEPLIRYNLEKLTDVYYIGWMGKHVPDLSAEIEPGDVTDFRKLYEQYTGNTYSFTGSGILLVNLESNRIVVLQEGIDVETSVGFIKSGADGVSKYKLPEVSNFYGWFTLLHPGRNNVIAEFHFNATEKGKTKLNEAGIPETFPAIIDIDRNCYFLAGNFGKCNTNLALSKIAIIAPLVCSVKSGSARPENFFYSFYEPFFTSILDNAIAMNKGTE